MRFRLLFLLAGMLLLVACSTPLNPTSRSPLHGRLVDAYSGDPVANARVVADSHEVTSATDGTYTLDSWSPDDVLEISAAGYETRQLPLETEPQIATTGETNTISLTIQLRPNTLQGSVTDQYSEEPLAGVRIIASEPGAQPQQATSDAAEATTAPAVTTIVSTTTGADGSYQLSGLPVRFTLEAQAAEYKPFTTELEHTIAQDIALRPDTLRGIITNRYTDEPIAGAFVTVGGITTTTSVQGQYMISGVPDTTPFSITIDAEGYALSSELVAQTAKMDASLRPDELEAQLLDKESGEPIAFATIIATENLTSTAMTRTRIDQSTDGRFTLKELPASGYVQVLAPGYRKAVMEIQPGSIPAQIALEPFFVKSLYIKTSTAAYQPDVLEEFFQIIDETELNAIVIDIKSDNMGDLGLIYYQSQVPIIKELGTSSDLFDIRAILDDARQRGIYTIARIHVFSHDNLLAETMPEWAAQDRGGCEPNENRLCNGNVFYADWDIAWLDPWNRNVWDYNIQLGVEAAQLGFDEIQFDYIRFASDAKNLEDMQLSKPIDPENNPQPMYENIATFMEHAHQAINDVGAFFSADVFGYASWNPQPTIGQHVGLMSEHADYICPMVYPSHYYVHELGFENAAAHPYEIVFESLRNGEVWMAGKRAKQRPWLQDFTLLWMPDEQIVEYGVQEVRAQIEATETFTNSTGWALWNADNEYTFEALLPEAPGQEEYTVTFIEKPATADDREIATEDSAADNNTQEPTPEEQQQSAPDEQESAPMVEVVIPTKDALPNIPRPVPTP
jgi:hypothetical protein